MCSLTDCNLERIQPSLKKSDYRLILLNRIIGDQAT
jgi:hypothetical protein